MGQLVEQASLIMTAQRGGGADPGAWLGRRLRRRVSECSADADLDMAETFAGQAAIALLALINSGSVSWLITGALRATFMITSSSGSSPQDSVCKASRQP
jgi:hypothetical protein